MATPHPIRMRPRPFIAALLAGAVVLVAAVSGAASRTSAPEAPTLSFRVEEGRNLNAFVRDGAVAAHLVLRSGRDPRIIVAFPAGNSGVGVWFGATRDAVTWALDQPPRPISGSDAKGRPLHGIEARVVIDANELSVDRALLSSIRVLRDYQSNGIVPEDVTTEPKASGNHLVWARDRLDGEAGYRLSIDALDGGTLTPSGVLKSAAGRPLRLQVSAMTGELPLTPLGGESLLTSFAGDDERARNALAFLSYEEKYLAGSWRFNTYFGRDTLISLDLLAPVMQPAAAETGLGSVLDRLAPNGEVAHEEDIGELAVLRNLREGRGRSAAPIYDYTMIDDDFLLAPVAAGWLLGSVAGRTRATAFLASPGATGMSRGDALVRNFSWVLRKSARFAADPRPQHLIALKENRAAGQWRDSPDGLGGGRYPYDVNAVLVPAALGAIERLVKSGLLEPYLSAAQRAELMRAGEQERAWSKHAPPLFVMSVPASEARERVARYAAQTGVDPRAALEAIGSDACVFDALSLDAEGKPVPVLHSDPGFALLFGRPRPADLERALAAVTRPFPAGLMTPIGLLVANPAFADRALQGRFTTSAYHGTVVWSWQQAVWVAGIDRQLGRADLPSPLRAKLASARLQLWAAIEATSALRTSELWSWSYQHGGYRAEPFGLRRADVDESNAVQLWSTVFLALREPQDAAEIAAAGR